MNKKIAQAAICLLLFSRLLPLVVGSDTVVSIEPFAIFPATDSNNKISSFAWMKNGFGLENSATTCEFSSVYPVSGTFDARGGKIVLENDLTFQNNIQFLSSASIDGKDHKIDLCQTMTLFATREGATFKDTKIFLGADLTMRGVVHIKGNTLIDGRWNTLILDDGACIIVDPGATFELRNMEIDGIKTGKFYCADNSGRLILNNMRWVQLDDYTFTNGSILFTNQVNSVGPYMFHYDSPLTSTIDYDSTWFLSDVLKLRIGRQQGIWGREPLCFLDRSSILKLENCTVNITPSGVQWTTGSVFIDREVRLDIESTSTLNGMHLGNGIGDDDLVWQLYPGAAVKMLQGHFVNDIVHVENFCSGKVLAKFIRAGSSLFYSKQNVEMANIELSLLDQSASGVLPGKMFRHKEVVIKTSVGDFEFTGTRYREWENFLDGNDSIRILSGIQPLPFFVQNANNSVLGTGEFLGPIFMTGAGSELRFNLDGLVATDVAMNGGKITLDRNLQLGTDVLLNGPGVVDLTSFDLAVRLKDKTWTGTIEWQGDNASIRLDSNFNLASTFDFSGDCIINGNNNELHLCPAGQLRVKKGSCLRFKNVTVSGVTESNIACLDNSASIILDNAKFVLADHYTFTQGSLLVTNNFDVVGTATFKYDSPVSSTIQMLSRLGINEGVRFEVGRYNHQTDREPWIFIDKTSVLELDGSTLAVNQHGFCVKKGVLQFRGDLTIEVNATDSTHGFKLGNNNIADDAYIVGASGVIMRFTKGPWIYACAEPNNLRTFGSNCHLYIYPAFNIYLDTNLDFPEMTIELVALGWGLDLAPGVILRYDNTTYSYSDIQMKLLCQRYNMSSILLNGNCQAMTIAGFMPFGVLVQGDGNILQGTGGVAGPIMLLDNASRLTLGVSGGLASNVTLNGGVVTLARPLSFDDNKNFIGTGTILQGSLSTVIGGQSLSSTSTLCWDCSGGYLYLRSNLTLNAQWTFSGNATINGAANSIIFGKGGSIKVERGSRLTFKDMIVKGITADSIWCADDAAQVVFDNMWVDLDADYTFSKGFLAINNLCILGGQDKRFVYASAAQSLIKSRATLCLDRDFTLAYAPIVPQSDRLAFEDDSSRLVLQEATLYSTATGLQLTKGCLEVQDHCYLESSALTKANGIMLGDGISAANDVTLDVHPGSNLELYSGYVVYKNLGYVEHKNE